MTIRILKKIDVFPSGDVPIYAEMINSPTNELMGPHGHDFSELTLISGGEAVHRVGNATAKVSKNDVVLIHPGLVHSFEEMSPDFSCISTYYDARVPYIPLLATGLPIISDIYPISMTQTEPEKPLVRIPEADSGPWVLLLKRLHYEVKYQRVGYKLLAFCQFSEFVLYINRNYSMSKDLSLHEGIAHAIRFINAHFTEPLSIPQLSKIAKMSVRAFYLYFMKVHGTSPYEYILKLRLFRVCELLENPRLTIEQISQQAGFSSSSHMSKIFKQRYNMSPKKYQMQLKK